MPSIFDFQPYAPYRAELTRRRVRYALYRSYYSGTAYDRLRGVVQAGKLYAGTRTLFSPLRRCVAVDVAKVPAAWALNEQDVSKATIERVRQLRKELALEPVYRRFLTYAAVVGEAGILMSGDPAAPRFTAHRPDEIVQGRTAEGEPFALIVKRVSGVGPAYEYAQVITAETVTTYKNGAPFGYDGAEAKTPNAFGFIPLAFGMYVEGEDGRGEPAFGGVLELLDRVNEIASLMLDVLVRNAEPLMVISGIRKDAIQMTDGDDTLVLEKENARAYTVNPNLSLSEALAFISDVRQEFKTLLPQLSIDGLRDHADLAYDSILTLLMELADHILAVREGVDAVVGQVERWALAASGGVPDDYELWTERRWIALSEAQQLDLESKRLEIQQRRQAPQVAAPAMNAPGAQEMMSNG